MIEPASAPSAAGLTEPVPRVTPGWLALREPADAAARAVELVEPLRRRRGGPALRVVHDLGCGTGSMPRWLAPRLDGAQHWVLHDRDHDLLGPAAAGSPVAAGDGAPVTVATVADDITRLTPDDLAGAGLITASALLDMLTAAELERIVATVAAAGCPALLTISVVGRVELDPPDPLDAVLESAFNAHQRRTSNGRRLLGPDAVAAARAGFIRHGVPVRTAPSPWHLGPDQAELAVEWLAGWVGAAVEQRPELADPAAAYARRRTDEAAAGRLRVVVHHCDLLAGHD